MPDKNKAIDPGGLMGAITRKLGDSTTGSQVRPLLQNLQGSHNTNPQKPSAASATVAAVSAQVNTPTPKLPEILKPQLQGQGKISRSQKQSSSSSPTSQSSRVPYSDVTQNAVIQYLRNIVSNQTARVEFRALFENIDREVARTNNLSAENKDAKRNNYQGNKAKNRMADITVPVVYPQTQAALAYLVGIFVTGNPIFEVVADPEKEELAVQFNALMQDHSVKTGWVRNLMMFLYDALKYNIACCEVDWMENSTYSLTTDDMSTTGASKNKQIQWEGNFISRKDLYNCFYDTRVHPAEIHSEGEFAGYTEILSRIRLKKLIQDLPESFNIKEAFESSRGGVGSDLYYVPQVTDKLNIDPRQNEMNWMNWALNSSNRSPINYKGVYEVTTLYARILPSDFDLRVPAQNTPQIWKFIIVNNSVLIHARRMTNAHNYFPLLFCQPLEDGLDFQTKSYSENLVEIQDMSSQLWNIRIASARRTVTDRAIYDPTRIAPSDINSSSPNAKIPLRPNAYGTDVRQAFFPIPFEDRTSQTLIADAMRVVDMGRSTTGINQPQEGSFIKGNRTVEEFQTISANANARLQMMAQFIEGQFFAPLKEILKINILQYQKSGSYYSASQKGTVNVDPVALRDAVLSFKVSDGLLPVSKLVDTDFLQMLVQSMLANQFLMQEFDSVALLDYIADLRNVPSLAKFRRQPNAGILQTSPGGPAIPGATPGSQQTT